MKAQHQGFFETCCTVYFCASGTCRLVPVRWVGVQLDPAARWQQKPRWSLEDSPTERLRFSPLLTFLRDSHWEDLHFLDFLSSPYLLLLLQRFSSPPSSSHGGLPNSPCFLQHLVTRSCQRWCLSATVQQQTGSIVTASWRATIAWNQTLSLDFCSLNHSVWRWIWCSVHTIPNNSEEQDGLRIIHKSLWQLRHWVVY